MKGTKTSSFTNPQVEQHDQLIKQLEGLNEQMRLEETEVKTQIEDQTKELDSCMSDSKNVRGHEGKL